jgi:hypothetical protein
MKQAPKDIKGAAISRRYNKYLKYRKGTEKTKTSFTSKLGKSEKPELKIESKPRRDLAEGRAETTTIAKPIKVSDKTKRITFKQACRIAKYAPHILKSSKKHNVPVELICGVILQESGGQHKAVSHAGARGLMQLMPATARRFGVKNSFDPAQNIEGGTKYLRYLMDHFNNDIKLVLAGYNAGEGNVKKYGNKIPPFRETQKYVPAVLAYTQSMIDILASAAPAPADLPSSARRV